MSRIQACVVHWPTAMKLSLVMLLALFGTPALPDVPKALPPLHLYVGEQRLVGVTGLARFSSGSGVIRVTMAPTGRKPDTSQPISESLLIKGVQPGGSDLWIWKTDGSIEHRPVQVLRPSSAAPAAFLRSLEGLQEAEIIHTAEGVVVRGTLTRWKEMERVAALSRAFPSQFKDETDIAEPLLEEGHQRLRTWLERSGRSGQIRIERVGQSLWIRGSVPSARILAQLEREARIVFPRVEAEVTSLPDQAPVVHFKVFLLEIKRSRFGAFGVQWPDVVQQAASLTTRALTESIRLDLAIQALEGEGSARVLSNPELVVRAPGEAELFAGGELPIRNSAAYFSNVSWKSYGLSLKLKVTHVAGEKVRLDIQTEVSHLAPEVSQDKSMPALEANRMKTQVDATFGAPLLLSGLLKQGVREQARGLPLLSRIPVLGSLFGSEDFINERSELVAILLPSASPPPAPMQDVERITPRGRIPLPRNWLPLERERALRADPTYPWNAFDGAGK